MKKIIVLGSTNTDMVIAGKKIPVPGETISGGKFLMNPGGKGANQAVAVARLSTKKGACQFIAKVGNDLFGRETAVRMKKDGIDAKLVVDKKEPSGTALILVAPNGQNVISVALGANGTLSPKDIAPYRKDIENAAALLLQLETPIKTVVAAAKWAHAKGVPVKHLSHYVRRGAKRLVTDGSHTETLAFVNPDNSVVVMMANKELTQKTVRISEGEKIYGVTLPASSVATLRF